MVVCKICNREFRNNRSLVHHLKMSHKNTPVKDYYDLYLCESKKGCAVCGNEVSFISLNDGYSEFCSNACVGKSPRVRSKVKKTCNDKYGGNAPTCSKNVMDLMSKNNQEKYGVDNVFQLEEVKNKYKETNLNRYGAEYLMQTTYGQNKRIETCLKKYGVTHPAKTPEMQKKINETSLEKYGVPHHLFTTESQDKRKETLLKNYGVTNPNDSPEIQLTKRAIIRTLHKDSLYTYFKEALIEPNFTEEHFLNKLNTVFTFTCKSCSLTFNFDCMQQGSLGDARCPVCVTKHRSHYEDEVAIALKEIGFSNIEKNIRFNLKEIDVYLPDLKFGIDFNGIYWHSTEFLIPKYHQNKWQHFKNLGIDYIQVFENEWVNKRELVLSIIKSKLGKNTPIYARKCVVKEISVDESKQFLTKNHLQGYIASKYKLGLFLGDKLLQVATFGKSRFDKAIDYELLRNCTEIGYRVIGGLSKLISNFRETHKGSIVSYCDLRYFNGVSYLKSGFKGVEITNPNYFYFKNNDNRMLLESRQKYQKHKLSGILDKFDSNLTEAENMKENGYLCIYDAGNLKLVSEQK